MPSLVPIVRAMQERNEFPHREKRRLSFDAIVLELKTASVYKRQSAVTNHTMCRKADANQSACSSWWGNAEFGR